MSPIDRALLRYAGFAVATAITAFLATWIPGPSWAQEQRPRSAAAPHDPPLQPADDRAMRDGQTSFAKNCAACHGADARGSGNIPALHSDDVKQAPDDDLLRTISEGKPNNGMPSWAHLPERERRDLVAFLRALNRGTLAASAAGTPQAATIGAQFDAPPPRAPFIDFRSEAPGASRKITAQDLPAPYATASANNGARLVAKPETAWPKAPAGFAVQRYASLEAPRQIHSAPNGDVFVALSRAGRIQLLRGVKDDGSAASSEVFLDGLNQPFGMVFYPPADPQWLYIGNNDAVVRVPYRSGDRTARGKPEHVLDLPAGGHWTRDLAVAADGKTLYVAVGSRSNVDDPDTTPAEKNRADILAFEADGSSMRVFASGIRNPVGLAIQPATGALWCSVNERDGLGDNLVPDYITHVRDGGFYGWPWWYIGAHQDPRHRDKHAELKDKTLVPDVLLQPHSASLGLAFYTGTQFPAAYRGDIFAAEHGSWNKSVRAGYEVIRVPLHQTSAASGEYEDFLTGFVLDNGEVWGRPVGVAVAADGALLVSDDGSGSIWRISYTGAATAR